MPLPIGMVWRESHATGALAASMVASVPAWLAAVALVAAIHGAPTVSRAIAWLAVSILAGGAWGLAVAFTAHHLSPSAGAVWASLYSLALWIVVRVAGVRDPGPLAHVVWGAALGPWFHLVRLGERRRHLKDH
jgi:hypothetical protein